jgi:cation diffusion facilitator family transporter
MVEKRNTLKKGEEASRLSTIIVLALSILRGVVSIASGSIALLAGTIDSFSDVFSSLAVWAGLNVAKKKPTERFPYGYFKAETLALLTVALILMASSVLIIWESFQRLFEVYVVSFSDLALGVAALSAVVYFLLARYKTRVGQQIGSQALKSEGLHSMVDVYASLLVFAGVFLGVLGFHSVEAVIGMAIGVYVLLRGFLYGKDAALILMDVSPDPKIANDIKAVAESVPGVKGSHDIRLRKSGPVFFGEIHIELQEGLSLEKAHAISEEVEGRVKENFTDVELVTVHVGLSHKKKILIAVPIAEDKGLDSLVSPHFGSVPYFGLALFEEGQVLSFFVKENKGAKLEHKKGIVAADLLVKEKVDVLLTADIGEGPFNVLGNNLVQIFEIPNAQLRIGEAIDLFNKKLLNRLEAPTEEDKTEK